MKLVLINDLPLFSAPPDATGFELAIRSRLEALSRYLPVDTTYVGFDDLVSTWNDVSISSTPEVILLVGTRPPLLTRFLPAGSVTARLVQLMTSRAHDAAGHTVSVRVNSSSDPAALRQSSHVTVVDDVAMSATTLHSVLGSGVIPADVRVSVRVAYATVQALHRLRAAYPAADIRAERVMDFAPVTEGTAIFLTSLFFGTLGGRPYLCQQELLRPFFGTDLVPLHRIRDLVLAMLPEVPDLSHRRAAG